MGGDSIVFTRVFGVSRILDKRLRQFSTMLAARVTLVCESLKATD
jgi:hypothetical protein